MKEQMIIKSKTDNYKNNKNKFNFIKLFLNY